VRGSCKATPLHQALGGLEAGGVVVRRGGTLALEGCRASMVSSVPQQAFRSMADKMMSSEDSQSQAVTFLGQVIPTEQHPSAGARLPAASSPYSGIALRSLHRHNKQACRPATQQCFMMAGSDALGSATML
jgi:hypothetical protein